MNLMKCSRLENVPYQFKRKIGQGGFGKVYKVIHKETGESYACKITKSNFQEAETLDKMKNCNNIIEYQDKLIFNDKLMLVMDLCEGNNVLDSIYSIESKDQREEYTRKYILQCINSIKNCHEKDVVHKDIKHTNFILSLNDMDSELKLIDFGLSRESGDFIQEKEGTLLYMPPEGLLITYHGINRNILNPSYDIWSLAVLIYLLHTGYDLFADNTQAKMVKRIIRGDISNIKKNIKNTKLRNLLQDMLTVSASSRPNINEVYERYNDCFHKKLW